MRGTESTRKSIQKLKKGERISANSVGNADTNHANLNSKRAVFILISHRGVQFVDIQSQVKKILFNYLIEIKNFTLKFREQYASMKYAT